MAGWYHPSAVVDTLFPLRPPGLRILLVAITFIAAACSSTEAQDLNCDGWELVFSDDFDDGIVDEERWYLYHYPGHDGNGLRRPEAISEQDGLLTITAREVDGTIVSGGMAAIHNQAYGRYEFRVRAEPDPNAVTSAVVLTWPASNDWPADGENNIFETGPASSRRPFASYIHYPDGTPLGGQEVYKHQAGGSEWHEMALIWKPLEMTLWLDGALVGRFTDPARIPDNEHRLTIQLDAMRTAPFEGEVSMYVDWVRVYQEAPIDPACA